MMIDQMTAGELVEKLEDVLAEFEAALRVDDRAAVRHARVHIERERGLLELVLWPERGNVVKAKKDAKLL